MKRQNILLTVSGAGTLLITAVMNLWLIPSIEAGTVGMRFFDMNSFGYTCEAAKAFLESLSVQGQSTALHIQLPLDFVYPLVYTCFFILLMRCLSGKKSPLAVFPVLLFVSDYIENICSIKMLKTDVLPYNLARFASTVTVIKSTLMCSVFVILAILAIKLLIAKRKTKGKK